MLKRPTSACLWCRFWRQAVFTGCQSCLGVFRWGRSWAFYLILASLSAVLLSDPTCADIFQKPIQKAQVIKAGLLTLSKVAVAISFVASLLAALAGRINWRWVGIIAGVALTIAGFDMYLTFLEIN